MRSRPYIATIDVEACARRAIARVASSSYGSAWRCSTAAGVSSRSCVPRWRMVTAWPRSTSPCTSGMPVGPVPPITSTRMPGSYFSRTSEMACE